MPTWLTQVNVSMTTAGADVSHRRRALGSGCLAHWHCSQDHHITRLTRDVGIPGWRPGSPSPACRNHPALNDDRWPVLLPPEPRRHPTGRSTVEVTLP
jgi:hypothetical protein